MWKKRPNSSARKSEKRSRNFWKAAAWSKPLVHVIAHSGIFLRLLDLVPGASECPTDYVSSRAHRDSHSAADEDG
jgi:hypothetical protein